MEVSPNSHLFKQGDKKAKEVALAQPPGFVFILFDRKWTQERELNRD